jgi:UDP:flavonoid glycosyltransferase YjiC (YdhE family)
MDVEVPRGSMSRILYAWELGNALGHAGSFLPLARALRERGHEIHWALAEVSPTAQMLARQGFAGIQAPRFPEVPRTDPPLSYNDILLRFGYQNANDLGSLVIAWRERILSTGAQLILADHAPTAILAARTLDVPVMLYSSGFSVPPRHRPLPGMRFWESHSMKELDALEQQVLQSVATVLARYGCKPLDSVSELFDVIEDTLLGFPELDHYAERGAARYWGNLPDAGIGTAPPWPGVPGKRIFAYLRRDLPHHEAALAALHALGLPAFVCFPDVPAELLARYAAPHLVVSSAPIDVVRAARETDIGLTYGSLNTTTCLLLAGKPLLILPGHLEQFMMARCVEDMGAGLLVHPQRPGTDIRVKLHEILTVPGYAFNAMAFAHKYSKISQAGVIANLVRRIEEIASFGVQAKSTSTA